MRSSSKKVFMNLQTLELEDLFQQPILSQTPQLVDGIIQELQQHLADIVRQVSNPVPDEEPSA